MDGTPYKSKADLSTDIWQRSCPPFAQRASMPVVSAHLKLMEELHLRMRRQVHKMLFSQRQLLIVHICSFKPNIAKPNKINSCSITY